MRKTINVIKLYLLFILIAIGNTGCVLDFLTPEETQEEGDQILGDWDLVRINGQRGPWNITTGDGQQLRIDRIGLEIEEGEYTQILEANGERGESNGAWIWQEEGESLILDGIDYEILELSEQKLEMESEAGAVFEYDRD